MFSDPEEYIKYLKEEGFDVSPTLTSAMMNLKSAHDEVLSFYEKSRRKGASDGIKAMGQGLWYIVNLLFPLHETTLAMIQDRLDVIENRLSSIESAGKSDLATAVDEDPYLDDEAKNIILELYYKLTENAQEEIEEEEHE